jgi:hypothetical protein
MFRFTIRDVLLMTAIVALATGWAIDRRQLARESLFRLAAFDTLSAFLLEKGYDAKIRGEFVDITNPDKSGVWIRIQ